MNTISNGVLAALVDGPLTVDELADVMSIPRPHIRAATTELVHLHRTITCDADGRFRLGVPPAWFPTTPKS